MLDKARLLQDWLLLRMRYEGWPGTPQLPAVRVLASQWKVPVHTVTEVLAGLVRRGALFRNVSRRYEVVGASAPVAAWELSASTKADSKAGVNSSWHLTYTRLRDDLAAGMADPQGRLPARKRLEAEYACNARTLRRALDRLVDEGLLAKASRGYRFAKSKLPEGAQRSRVYLTGYTGPMRSFLARHHAFVRAAEAEMHRLGGELRLFVSDQPGEEPRAPMADEVAGYITLASERPDRGFEWLRYFETHRRIPLVVLDPPERAKRYARQTSLCKVLPDNRRAGREVGAHLVAGKHRRAAFFAPFALERGWASLRLAGLQETLSIAKAQLDIHICVAKVPSDRETMLTETVRHRLGELHKELTAPGCLEKEVLGDAFRAAYDLLPSVHAWAALETAFSSALRRDCSAWVCLHDGVAAVAWSFLKRHGALKKVRLIGFDNSPMAYALGFSSYDFGYDAMGRWAVQWLMTPGKTRTLQRVPGQLMVRDAGQAL